MKCGGLLNPLIDPAAKFYEQDGVIKISPIRGAVNPANVLTKFTFGSVFIKERRYIMGILHD